MHSFHSVVWRCLETFVFKCCAVCVTGNKMLPAVLVLLMLVCCTCGENPAIQLSLSDRGLQYGERWVVVPFAYTQACFTGSCTIMKLQVFKAAKSMSILEICSFNDDFNFNNALFVPAKHKGTDWVQQEVLHATLPDISGEVSIGIGSVHYTLSE